MVVLFIESCQFLEISMKQHKFYDYLISRESVDILFLLLINSKINQKQSSGRHNFRGSDKASLLQVANPNHHFN